MAGWMLPKGQVQAYQMEKKSHREEGPLGGGRGRIPASEGPVVGEQRARLRKRKLPLRGKEGSGLGEKRN